jgi:hypothetical protein
VHAERTEVGILLQAPDGLDRLEVDLAHARGPPVGLVFQTLLAFLDPPFEDPVDGGFMHPEVPCDARPSSL